MNTSRIILEIPAEILAAVKLPPQEIEQELRKELALALYKRGSLSFGKARMLAQLSSWEFDDLLGQGNYSGTHLFITYIGNIAPFSE